VGTPPTADAPVAVFTNRQHPIAIGFEIHSFKDLFKKSEKVF
jgi:hypothetical protein